MRARWTAFALVPILAALAGSGQATTLRKLSTRDLLVRSDLIIVGKVLSTESRWLFPIGMIVTDVTFSVERRAKGGPGPSTIVVRNPGGRVGDVAQDVDGVPAFAPGDEVLLFLDRLSDGVNVLMGLSQGKVDLVRDATGRLVMERTVEAQKVRGLPRALQPGESVLYLDDFLDNPGVDLE
jgi:hypothetical protein